MVCLNGQRLLQSAIVIKILIHSGISQVRVDLETQRYLVGLDNFAKLLRGYLASCAIEVKCVGAYE